MYPIRYEEPVFRPPGEAQSLLIQVTIGCSHNRCTFCSMYRRKQYRVRGLAEIQSDLELAARYYERAGVEVRKVFLCDGDALAAPEDLLSAVCERAAALFPRLRRIGIYASTRNVLGKSEASLSALAARRLSIAYLGLESGCDAVLRLAGKGSTAGEFVEAAHRLARSAWQTSSIVMLGLGGRRYTEEHARETARVVSGAPPDFLSFLTTAAVPGTPYHAALQRGEIEPLSSKELLEEMRATIEAIDVPCGTRRGIIFRANHVSNLFPLEGALPKDRDRLLEQLEDWIERCPEDHYPQIDPFAL